MSKVPLLISNLFRNKKFITFASLFSIVQGLARVELINIIPSNSVSFLTNDIFGWIMLVFGVLSLVVTFTKYRQGWTGRIISVILAAAYGALGAAVINASTTSAIGSFLICAFLIIEASIIHDC